MSFSDIYGQERQKAVLQSAMERGRVSHAYLFHGMKGVGKKTTAGIFARALNCSEKGFDSCDSCSSCVKMDHGNHPNFILIEPEGFFIKIEAVRGLQGQIKFRPFEGQKRVFVIADAERMNSPAANALLKTLEEPTSSNILILISSRPHELPRTVVSRCQRLRFNPLARDVISAFLMERYSVDERSARLIAASSGGSIGRALEMKEESYLSFKNGVIERISDSKASKDPLEFLSFVDYLGDDRKKVLEKLDIMKSWYRDILVYKETDDVDGLIHRDIVDRTRKNSRKMSGADILQNIRVIKEAYSAIEQNANRQLTLEAMMFKLRGTAYDMGGDSPRFGLK
ncbi:MAG: DNA polymerase III subunit delta' [Deltaproteobacteria bacterium]|nr:DNA polymerase III subunit delta' [Deltaproteobacteria bacterium]MBN2846408.1 DNA polymerase III subunit delta' [Deltaproteobacteria bacterium]